MDLESGENSSFVKNLTMITTALRKTCEHLCYLAEMCLEWDFPAKL